MVSQLNTPVHTLSQLKSTLDLLHHIADLQNIIDSVYYPVEKLYSLLRSDTTFTSELNYNPRMFGLN